MATSKRGREAKRRRKALSIRKRRKKRLEKLDRWLEAEPEARRDAEESGLRFRVSVIGTRHSETYHWMLDPQLQGRGRDGADPRLPERRAAEAVRAVLADLDRRFSVPPVAFCRELAVEVVAALKDEPGLLEDLAVLIAREAVAEARRIREREGRT